MKKAFTLVELIVVITILAVLSTIGFISMVGYSKSAKNSVVLSDLRNMKKAFDLHVLKGNRLPLPDGPVINITAADGVVATQGYLGKTVVAAVDSITSAPKKPDSQDLFSYSRTQYSNEYQLMADFYQTANNDSNLLFDLYANDEKAKRIEGNYNGLVAYTFTGGVNYVVALPSLMTTATGSDINVNDTNKNLYENNSSKFIEYSPRTLWRGKDMPQNPQEISQFLETISLAYEESSIHSSYRVKNISEGQDSNLYHETTNAILRKLPGIDKNLTNDIIRQCDVDGGDVRQKFVGGEWGECYRVACYAGFTPVGEFGCEWNNSGFTLDADNFTQSDEPIFQLHENNGENMFYQEGQRAFYTSGFIPVDTSKTYRLSGKFKKLGGDDNIMYFGLKSFDENKEVINAWKVGRVGNDVTIQSFDDEKITGIETPTGWKTGDVSFHYQSIGIYYDGDTTKLPDHVLKWEDFWYSTEERTPAYSEIIGNDIMLNRKIPDEIAANIIPGITKIKNHHSGSTFIYFYAPGTTSATLLEDWETRSGELTGEHFSTGNAKFRTGTKYVQIHILSNWKANAGVEYKMGFDDIVFEQLP